MDQPLIRHEVSEAKNTETISHELHHDSPCLILIRLHREFSSHQLRINSQSLEKLSSKARNPKESQRTRKNGIPKQSSNSLQTVEGNSPIFDISEAKPLLWSSPLPLRWSAKALALRRAAALGDLDSQDERGGGTALPWQPWLKDGDWWLQVG